ncbi:U4 tri-snRNP-associated 1 [Sigmodon hispidus]
MVDKEQADKNVELRKKKPDYLPYAEDESVDDLAQQKPRSILAKYDEELEGERPHFFRLKQGGMADGLRECELEEILAKLHLQAQSLSSMGPRLASEYLSPEEMVTFKKTKQRVKKIRKKEKEVVMRTDDCCLLGTRLRMGTLDPGFVDRDSAKFPRCKRRPWRKRRRTLLPSPHWSPEVLEEDEAELELQKQLEKGRRLRQLQQLRDSREKVVIVKKLETRQRGWEEEEDPERNKGLLETTMQKVAHVKAPNKSLPWAVYCIEDKMASDDKYSWRKEYRDFTQDFKEKDGYKPDVKIEYMDETGRKLTPKEAFWHISHHFHGKCSGKMKTERRMKKLDEEVLLKKMSSSDTPLGTVALLQEKQKAQKTPYIVLSGSGKSMNANTITK